MHRNSAHNKMLVLVIGILLIVGIGIVFMDLDVDPFDVDEYKLGEEVTDNNFSSFMATTNYTRPFYKLQAWPMFKFAGFIKNSTNYYEGFTWALMWTRIPAALAAVLHILLVLSATRHLWPRHFITPLIVGFFLVLNSELDFYSRTAMSMHIQYLLMTSAVYFLSLTLCSGPVTRRKNITIVLVSALTPLTYFPTFPAFFTSVFLILVFRLFNLPQKSVRLALSEVWKLRYFAVAVPSYFLSGFTEILKQGNGAYRPALYRYYFNLSEYPKDLGGALDFVQHNTLLLFSGLIGIKTSISTKMDAYLLQTCLLLLFAGIVIPCVPSGKMGQIGLNC